MPPIRHVDYPPSLSSEREQYIVSTIKNWSIQHGLTVRPSLAFVPEGSDQNGVLATTAPVTIFPSIFPRSCFQQANMLQTTYNELYAAISSDEGWIEDMIKGLIDVDDFVQNLWKVHQSVKEEGYVQNLSLGLFRSDYMLHAPLKQGSPVLKQVEFNTISSSFGALSTLVSSLHGHLMTFPEPAAHLAYPPHDLFVKKAVQQGSSELDLMASEPLDNVNLPPKNEAVQVLGKGLSFAHLAYGPSKSQPRLPLCILFLVQEGERNIFDQLALSSNSVVPIFRLLTSEILSQTTIDVANPRRPLVYSAPSSPETQFEVTTIYFRAFYSPSEYSLPDSWAARLHLERSAAIKCPSILAQLAGCKKIQQVLTSESPDHLRRFLPNADATTLSSLRSTFARQYEIASNSQGLSIALDPHLAADHVLKPQREGGGNNIYRSSIPEFLKSLPSTSHYNSYILMELINPPAEAKNTVLRSDGRLVSGNVVNELGIFGACLWRQNVDQDRATPGLSDDGGAGAGVRGSGGPEILLNEGGGYLVRTKGRDSDEGGVAAGFSSLDSVILYDDDDDDDHKDES